MRLPVRIDTERHALAQTALPKSPLGDAVRYLTNQWAALQRFVEDGRLAIDNNLCDAASGINDGMPPTGLCRVRPRGGVPRREIECVSVDQAA